jgi:2-phospho-L-lactate transferase/gluconeogenesis factor (CofD/UPF0052 family)
LRVYDLEHGARSGESNIEKRSESPVAVNVEGPTHANPEALRAVMDAEIVFIGPGSFIGSTLAALTTGDLARALVSTRARRVFIQNLEREGTASYGIDEHERILRDHIIIKSGGDNPPIDTLTHTRSGHRADGRSDGSIEYASPLTRPREHTHDEELLVKALMQHFGLSLVSERPIPEVDDQAIALFEDALTRARRRLLEQ